MQITEQENSNLQLEKSDSGQIFYSNNKDDLLNDTIELTHEKTP